MKNTTLIAIAKYFDKQSKEIKLEPGDYPVDDVITIQIKGCIKKSEDCEVIQDINLLHVLAIVLVKEGYSGNRLVSMLISAISASLQEKTLEKETIKLAMEGITKAKGVVQWMLPKKAKSGPTNVHVIVSELTPLTGE